MQSKGFNINLFLDSQIVTFTFLFSITVVGGLGGEYSSESESFFQFIEVADHQYELKVSDQIGSNSIPCLPKLKYLKCNSQSSTILELWHGYLDLSGILDTNPLSKLPNLRVISLAKNRILGTIPNSESNCKKLNCLNLSSNDLNGRIPEALTRLKCCLKRLVLDNSNNNFMKQQNLHSKGLMKVKGRKMLQVLEIQDSNNSGGSQHSNKDKWANWIPWTVGIGFFLVFIYFVGKRIAKFGKEMESTKPSVLQDDPRKTPPASKSEEKEKDDLVFFMEKQETFNLEELLEATADLRRQSNCSSLFYASLKNNAQYVVKILKKIKVTPEEFDQTMRQIGNLKHPNILPLVAYASIHGDKLLVYKHQSNASLLNLLENGVKDEKDFPWRLRLSIAGGIAKGLDFIYQNQENNIPHGHLKLSNILLDEKQDPLISEYGLSRFQDPSSSVSSKGYTAPERGVTDKGDVFSFGVILLELLTGQMVEKTNIDLPKWVRAIIREEWTGEVFDKGIAKSAKQWAFPVLNIALKCVSHSPEDRPTMAEVLEKIEEVIYAQEDHSVSSASCQSHDEDCCPLHNILSESWDTPASNY